LSIFPSVYRSALCPRLQRNGLQFIIIIMVSRSI